MAPASILERAAKQVVNPEEPKPTASTTTLDRIDDAPSNGLNSEAQIDKENTLYQREANILNISPGKFPAIESDLKHHPPAPHPTARPPPPPPPPRPYDPKNPGDVFTKIMPLVNIPPRHPPVPPAHPKPTMVPAKSVALPRVQKRETSALESVTSTVTENLDGFVQPTATQLAPSSGSFTPFAQDGAVSSHYKRGLLQDDRLSSSPVIFMAIIVVLCIVLGIMMRRRRN